MRSLLCLISLFAGLHPAFAADVTLERLKPLQVITEVPNTAWQTLKFSFQRDSTPVWAGLIASSAVLLQYDPDILRWSQGAGRRWNIGNSDHTKTVIQAGPYPLLRLASDAGSWVVFKR
jgi:hypothetical protein